MAVMLHTKQFFRIIEEIEVVLALDHDKEKYLNLLDEAHGHLFSLVSRYISFHVQGLKTPKDI